MSLLPMAEYLRVSPGTNPSTNDTYRISTKKKTIKRIEASLWYVAKPKSQPFLIVR